MPLYLDMHTIAGGVSAEDVAGAHKADVRAQGGYDARYLSYWVSEQPGKALCRVEAPSADAGAAVHRRAHGLVADEVFQVQEGS